MAVVSELLSCLGAMMLWSRMKSRAEEAKGATLWAVDFEVFPPACGKFGHLRDKSNQLQKS